ncbi:IclR family transcriptional regulator domain-containing protein [Brevibacterium marinum]|uniref:IclR family acetate operon transcriptional repressor n=1 Tax=Brevibacterium marinum TaxID=418643 RepID=A0A846S1H3_9MICO|nr:IclR family acetate operon transcriptional repressor [Brevibacterium marinum]
MTGSNSAGPIRSVVNALRVIEALAEHKEIGVSELARRLEMPKTSTYRSLETLAHAGWVTPSGEDRARWSLTNRALIIGLSTASAGNLTQLAVREMNGVRDVIGETMHLLMLDGLDHVVVARVDGTNPIRTFLELGTRPMFHSTSSGRSLLSVMAEADVAEILDREAREQDFDRAEVLDEVRLTRERGYALNHAEWRTNIAAVGVPVVTQQGVPLAAISISMPLTSFLEHDHERVGRLLVEAGARITESLIC